VAGAHGSQGIEKSCRIYETIIAHCYSLSIVTYKCLDAERARPYAPVAGPAVDGEHTRDLLIFFGWDLPKYTVRCVLAEAH